MEEADSMKNRMDCVMTSVINVERSIERFIIDTEGISNELYSLEFAFHGGFSQFEE